MKLYCDYILKKLFYIKRLYFKEIHSNYLTFNTRFGVLTKPLECDLISIKIYQYCIYSVAMKYRTWVVENYLILIGSFSISCRLLTYIMPSFACYVVYRNHIMREIPVFVITNRFCNDFAYVRNLNIGLIINKFAMHSDCRVRDQIYM